MSISVNPSLLLSLFQVKETKNEVILVQIFAQITKAKAFSYQITQELKAESISKIVARLD
ncbi:MAG: hypothetical protein LBQ24_06805 [Candidatus Peribacteria bacterium]|jgi:hypothetical protein|nr:hypothetical protein [Candidatus Peribacteria bacterium]